MIKRLLVIGLLLLSNTLHAKINWSSDFSASLKKAGKENKNVLLYWKAKWCPTCITLERVVFIDKELISFIGKRIIPIKIDIDDAGADKLAKKFAIKGFPSLLLLNPQGEEMTRFPPALGKKEYLGALKRFEGKSLRIRQKIKQYAVNFPQDLPEGEIELLADYSWRELFRKRGLKPSQRVKVFSRLFREAIEHKVAPEYRDRLYVLRMRALHTLALKALSRERKRRSKLKNTFDGLEVKASDKPITYLEMLPKYISWNKEREIQFAESLLSDPKRILANYRRLINGLENFLTYLCFGEKKCHQRLYRAWGKGWGKLSKQLSELERTPYYFAFLAFERVKLMEVQPKKDYTDYIKKLSCFKLPPNNKVAKEIAKKINSLDDLKLSQQERQVFLRDSLDSVKELNGIIGVLDFIKGQFNKGVAEKSYFADVMLDVAKENPKIYAKILEEIIDGWTKVKGEKSIAALGIPIVQSVLKAKDVGLAKKIQVVEKVLTVDILNEATSNKKTMIEIHKAIKQLVTKKENKDTEELKLLTKFRKKLERRCLHSKDIKRCLFVVYPEAKKIEMKKESTLEKG